MARIYLVSPKAFEPWDWRSPDTPGIGGSETMHCEMAWRLAARGHQVTSYSAIAEGLRQPYKDVGQALTHVHRGVSWRHLDEIDLSQPGLWIFIRGIEYLDHFTPTAQQRVWCVFQDVDISDGWPEEWYAKVDRILALCSTHAAFL